LVWDKIIAGSLTGPQLADFGQRLSDLFLQLGGLLEIAHHLQAARQEVSEEAPFDPLQMSRARLRKLQQDHVTDWPRLDSVDLQVLRAKAARGESLEITDAFAEIVGVTREDWLRHVE